MKSKTLNLLTEEKVDLSPATWLLIFDVFVSRETRHLHLHLFVFAPSRHHCYVPHVPGASWLNLLKC